MDEEKMVEVSARLAPRDGLTNSTFQLVSMHLAGGGSLDFDFELRGEDGRVVGTFTVNAGPTRGLESTDALIAKAYDRMIDVTRQWLNGFDVLQRHYAARLKKD